MQPYQMTPQDREMRAILAQLQLVSAIPAQNLNSSPSSDDSPLGRRPPGDDGYLLYARWYGHPFFNPTPEFPGCATTDERIACISAARSELQHLRRTTRVEITETPEQTREQLLAETEGWSPQAVSTSHWRISTTVLRRIRVAAGRDAETGRIVVHNEPADGLDLASRARDMKRNGMSQRQIALALGVHKTQVARFLSRVA